jgi:pimeloyl-ACP methyl ester carboxylesterase
LREIPRVLFTATLTYPDFPASAEELKVKQRSHAEWMAAMPGTRQVVVPESRHYVHNDVPGLIVAEIRAVAKAVARRAR